jgi:hypothetical protein
MIIVVFVVVITTTTTIIIIIIIIITITQVSNSYDWNRVARCRKDVDNATTLVK